MSGLWDWLYANVWGNLVADSVASALTAAWTITRVRRHLTTHHEGLLQHVEEAARRTYAELNDHVARGSLPDLPPDEQETP